MAQISSHHEVERVIALGTLFALELRVNGKDSGLVMEIVFRLLSISFKI